MALRGDFTGAIGFLKQALELAENAAASKPNHPFLRGHIVQCKEKLGDAYHDLRDNDRALPYLEKSLRLTIAIQDKDPESGTRCRSVRNAWEITGFKPAILPRRRRCMSKCSKQLNRRPAAIPGIDSCRKGWHFLTPKSARHTTFCNNMMKRPERIRKPQRSVASLACGALEQQMGGLLRCAGLLHLSVLPAAKK